MKFIKEYTCSFTGHRPQKLPWKFDDFNKQCLKIKKQTKKEIKKLIKKGYVNFLVGMALGFDTYVCEILLDLKQKFKHIKIFGIIPCKNQDEMWSRELKERYLFLLTQLDEKIILNETYTKTCMKERNEFMLNNSSCLIALFNGANGRTKNTIEQAIKLNLKIKIIKP